MKILVVQDYLRSGGTERQSVLLANAFAARGHDAALFTFRPGGTLAPTVASAVARRTLQPLDLGLDWFAPGLMSKARGFAPDVILCMGRMANCYGVALQRALPRSAVIGTMRTGKPLPRQFRTSLHAERHVIANSKEARDNLVRLYGVDPAKISVIYNSLVFPSPAVPGTRDRLRAQHGARTSTTVLLCVAMFRPEKRQRELIATLAGLPRELDWQLWLAGEGPALAACQRAAFVDGVGDRVRFLGLVRDPSPLYAAADMAVHASASESLSNFLIEAQAHGLPAVAFAAQGFGESFLPGRTGWVIERGDAAAFRMRVQQLARLSPPERGALAEDARQYARHTFDPDRQVDAYLQLFDRLRGGGGTRS